MVLTDTEVQNTLDEALAILIPALDAEQAKTNNELNVLRMTILLSSLLTLKMLSKSSNNIPSLRGLGLDEGLALAHTIIDKGAEPFRVALHHQSLFEGIEIK